jgi:hypothetical protein
VYPPSNNIALCNCVDAPRLVLSSHNRGAIVLARVHTGALDGKARDSDIIDTTSATSRRVSRSAHHAFLPISSTLKTTTTRPYPYILIQLQSRPFRHSNPQITCSSPALSSCHHNSSTIHHTRHQDHHHSRNDPRMSRHVCSTSAWLRSRVTRSRLHRSARTRPIR